MGIKKVLQEDRDHFLLGTFATNCSGGMTVSTLPDRWESSWKNNVELGVMLDEAGIDFMLPIARWIGYRGETNFHGNVLETVTWATALLALTKDITVFSTLHTTANHPVVVAKQIATMAEISSDRVGLNIVAGWNKPEYDALGIDLPDDHDTRYEYAQEWYDVINKLWNHEGRFDWDGKYFHLEQIHSDPRPNSQPPIFNAAGSAEGKEFASNNADFLFTPVMDLSRSKSEIKEIKEQALAKDRKVGVLTFSHVVCRPTQEEAGAEWKRLVDNEDTGAVDNLMNLQFSHAQSFSHDLLAEIRERMAVGHGGFPLVGTPEEVADRITALHEAGFSGSTLSFFDYKNEFPYFRDNVLPILRARGIREY